MSRAFSMFTLIGSLLLGLAAGQSGAQTEVRMPSEFETSGSELGALFTFFGGVSDASASLDAEIVHSGNSCRLNIGFQPDANFTRAGAGFGTLGIVPPNVAVSSGADTFSITIHGPAQGTLSFRVTLREDDDADGIIDPDVGDDQWESDAIFISSGTNVYNIPLSSFLNVGSGNDAQDFSTTPMLAWFLTIETDAAYSGGIITTPISLLIDHAGLYAGTQTIPAATPTPQVTFHERWNSTASGTLTPGQTITGDEGAWQFAATEPGSPRAQTLSRNASQTARVSTGTAAAAWLTRTNVAVPMSSATTLSFSAWSELVSPQPGVSGCTAPCGDMAFVRLTDNRGNQVVYIFDHADADTPLPTTSGYHEIFLSRGTGRYERSILADFAALPGYDTSGAAVASIEFRVQNIGGTGTIDDLRISSETLLGSGLGATTHASADAAGRTTITYVSSTGRPVILQRSSTGVWTTQTADEAVPGIPVSVGAGATGTWVDPRDGDSYVSIASSAGLFVIDVSDTTPGARNLTEELATTPGISTITGQSTVFTSVDGLVNIVGINPSGEFVRYFQTGTTTGGVPTWGYMNISATQLTPNGITTPAIVSNLVPYVAAWGGLHIAGLDASGDIHAVWWAPGARHWFANNLSEERGTPSMLPGAGLSAYVTPWGGLNLAGIDVSGHAVVLWWAPALGDGNWQNTDLTQAYSGPTLSEVGLASFVTPWGALNVAGVTPSGDLVNYWWVPGFDSWLVTSISGASVDQGTPRIESGLSGIGSPSGTISLIGTSDNGDVVRYYWNPADGPTWHHENAREQATRR